MIRKIFLVALTLGAVAIGATCGLSYVITAGADRDGRNKGLSWGNPYPEDEGLYLAATEGRLCFLKGSRWDYDRQVWTKGPFWDWASFCVLNDPRHGGGEAMRGLELPMSCIFVFFAAYPAIAFIRGPLRRWRWRRKGLCLRCSCDLTGNVSGRCPECGTEVEK